MSHPRIVRVLVVDGEPLTRAGLVACVRHWKNHRLCGQAKDAPEARRLCAEARPDLIIVVLPAAGDGCGLIRDLPRLHRAVGIVAVGARGDRETVERVLRAGARGYVRRSDDLEELRQACAAAVQGKFHMSHGANQALLSELAHPPRAGGAGDRGRLSERERTVFELIARELGATAIARELGVSVKTVETHQRRIREKLDLPTAEALRQRARAGPEAARAPLARPSQGRR